MYRDSEREPFERDTPRGVLIERQPVRRSIDDTPPRHRVEETTDLRESAGSPGDFLSATMHWRTTLAGTLAALTVLLFMGLLGLAIGLTQFNAATAATEGALPAGFGRDIGLWAAFSMLLAFLVGGFVAARREMGEHGDFGATARPEHGAWLGVLVFLLATPLLMWMLLGGLTGAASAMTSTIAGLHVDPSTQARVNPTAVGDMAGHLRDATWGTLFGCLLGLAGSVLGGVLAFRRDHLRPARVKPTIDARSRR